MPLQVIEVTLYVANIFRGLMLVDIITGGVIMVDVLADV